MGVRLVEILIDKSIPVSEMKDGEIGTITKWTYKNAVGTIVQRYNDILVTVGRPSGCSWPSIFPNGDINCRIRILEKGDTLIIE